MKILFIGDVIGKIGRKTIRALLPKIIDYHKVDFVIANGENIAGGFGLTKNTMSEMFDSGVDVITTGNHVWDKKESKILLREEKRLLRPANYPPKNVPGKGAGIYEKNGCKIGVLNLIGRLFMDYYDDPFRCADEYISWMKKEAPILIVDFHAEATSEKQAIGYYLNGRVTAVLGTHTHVQTADEKILDGQTAYISDAGMVGPVDSIIGLNKDEAMMRFLTRIPHRFLEVAKGDSIMGAVIVEADEKTGHAKSINRISPGHTVLG
ncbi:MAG: 2',3'-cyclic-nucleotide 2'-phosphodiesterase [bacterium]|nr:MAG: 2',3'-cyclic-nucleotide 2'-phosphodiesterase [bacterium]